MKALMAINNTDYKKEWFAKARVDYFSPFINLWLACNSWYNFHYSLNQDRAHVDKLKTEFGNSNKLYAAFTRCFANGSSKDEKSFLSLLELLHYSLNQAEIKPTKFHESKRLTLHCLLIDYEQKKESTAYWDCIITNALKKDGTLKSNQQGIILNSTLVLSAEKEKVFAGLIELIYQVRCALVHGELAPTNENHEVVKYCYLILFELMREFCE
jgi:hypothetical protein